MGRGRFITLEGGEGAGKSTQAAQIVAYLTQRGIKAIATREVGGAPGAEDIRSLWLSKHQGFWDPLTEVLLIMAARREHLTKTILPALEAGVWVISDRFVDSTRAYQGIGLGLGVEVIDALYHHVAGDFWPDLTLVLDLPVEAGLSRMTARSGAADRYEQQDVAFHETLRAAFLQLAAQEPQRIAIIDAVKAPGDVSTQIATCIDQLIESGMR
ncbi:MAG TPA: dTMP kinase [Rhodospirillaceae bacterium]|nr:dTMP kinase [Rhodospirillaceae bacterium]